MSSDIPEMVRSCSVAATCGRPSNIDDQVKLPRKHHKYSALPVSALGASWHASRPDEAQMNPIDNANGKANSKKTGKASDKTTTDGHSLLTSTLVDLTSRLEYYQKTATPVAAASSDNPTNVSPNIHSSFSMSDHQILDTNPSRAIGENAFNLGFRSGRVYQGAYQHGYHKGFIDGLGMAIVNLENIIRQQTEKADLKETEEGRYKKDKLKKVEGHTDKPHIKEADGGDERRTDVPRETLRR